MTMRVGFYRAVVIFCAASTCQAQTPLKLLLEPSKVVLEKMLTINSQNPSLKSAKPAECTKDEFECGPYLVTVTETVDRDDRTKVIGCVVTMDDITVGRPSDIADKFTKIKLKLVVKGDPKTLKGEYSFRENGIVVVSEGIAERAMIPINYISRLDDGQRVHFRHVYGSGNTAGKEAIYFPIVVQKIDGQDVFMCGAGDPKIVNG